MRFLTRTWSSRNSSQQLCRQFAPLTVHHLSHLGIDLVKHRLDGGHDVITPLDVATLTSAMSVLQEDCDRATVDYVAVSPPDGVVTTPPDYLVVPGLSRDSSFRRSRRSQSGDTCLPELIKRGKYVAV